MVDSSDNRSMIQKKYLLISLVTAALLTGCSANSDASNTNPDQPAVSAEATGNGVTNGSLKDSDIKRVPAGTFEEGAMENVQLPESVTKSKGYVAVPFEGVSGSVVETEDEATAVYNTFNREATRKWITELKAAGWAENAMETIDNETTYNALLSKDEKMISIYSNNTPETKNTVISFSK